jgi:hypothetical protein
MYSRAIHVEILDDMTTDALLNALRCFICIRGAVRSIYCDRGTNIIGAKNELAKEMQETDPRIAKFFQDNEIIFKVNPPQASHAGGVWERQIRNIRSVLNGMARVYKGRLDTSSLRTAFYEAMAVVNSRPLSIDNLNTPTETAITPNHLITMKSQNITAPPGNFGTADVYGRKMWRKVQQFAEEFWDGWKGGYLREITKRQRWQSQHRNLMAGDLVLLSDSNLPRSEWSTAVVEDVLQGSDGLTRTARVRLANRHIDRNGKAISPATILERPIQKLVLLLPCQDNRGL